MAESSFRSNLLLKNQDFCFRYIESNLFGEKLVLAIHDLLFLSVSVKTNDEFLHPVCVVNSLKNIISDDKKNPSKILLKFAIDYLFQFDLREDDKKLLDKIQEKGVVKTAFVGDLEDAFRHEEWRKAESLIAELFIASDQSRGTFDFLAELALQDCPSNVLFIYHILRAYQFQVNKDDNWVFTLAIFYQIYNKVLLKPHRGENFEPNGLLNQVIKNGDLVLYAAMKRIWESEYVRSRGYNREISYWLSKINFHQLVATNKEFKIENFNQNSFISITENLLKGNSITEQKLKGLVTLEALRSIMKGIDKNQYKLLLSRFAHLLK